MRSLVLSICFVAALSSATATTHGDQLMSHFKIKYLEGYMRERQAIDEFTSKLEEFCPGSKLKVEDALNKLTECANEIDETKETSCSIAKNRMPKCLEPFVKVMKDCMPEESKGIPDFAIKALVKGIDYICKTDGEHIFELGNTCVYKKNPLTDTCSRKIQMKLMTYKREGFGVSQLCGLMKFVRPCMKSHLSLSCGSPITVEAILGFLDAVTTTCDTVTDVSVNEVEDVKDTDYKLPRGYDVEDFS